MFSPWEDVKLHPVPIDADYGFNFPKECNQFTRELILFSKTWYGPVGGSLERWEHGLNIIRMLWDNKDVTIWKKCQGKIIYNTYFLNTFRKLCQGKNIALTGPAAASKTFAVAVYLLLCFFSAPLETSALISTTSGSSAERRVWGEIKSLHTSAQFAKWIDAPDGGTPSIGRVIDYLKCVTFDPNKEIDGQKHTSRDLRNGVILIPIANDSTGQNALDTIIGTHNKYVLWAVDELPTMMDGVTRPRSNLTANEYSQFIGIGNAADHQDPHGLVCTPKDGWESIDKSFTREWEGKTVDVLFLHGEESPNDHPGLDQSIIKTKSDFPFPYLSSRIMREEIAYVEGDGDIEEGKTKLGFLRMGIGFWPMEGAVDTILTAQLVRKYGAHQPPEPWDPSGFTVYWSLDPAFTSGGDENILFPIRVGRTYAGMMQIVMPHDGIRISPSASSKDDYRSMACLEIQKQLTKLGAKPENGCMDAMNDGGLMYADLAKLLDTHKIQPLTSLGKSPNSKYHDWVTDYWYGMLPFIKTGYVRGFDTNSGYAKDLFARRYSTKSGKIKVEGKDEMKERIKRSPDRGDACSYTCWLINSRLGLAGLDDVLKQNRKKYNDYMNGKAEVTEDYFTNKTQDYESMLV